MTKPAFDLDGLAQFAFAQLKQNGVQFGGSSERADGFGRRGFGRVAGFQVEFLGEVVERLVIGLAHGAGHLIRFVRSLCIDLGE